MCACVCVEGGGGEGGGAAEIGGDEIDMRETTDAREGESA